MKLTLNYVLFVFFFLAQLSSAQKKVEITVTLPTSIDYSKLTIYFDNGQSEKKIIPVIVDGRFNVYDSCYSRYAAITFCYPDSTETDGIPGFCFWVSDKPAKIIFNKDDLSNANPFRNSLIENVYLPANMGETQYFKFISSESDDSKNFYLRNKDFFSKSNELQTILDEKLEKLANRKLEFIRSNPFKYYSLWVFNRELAGGRNLKADSLIRFYNQIFPDSLKHSFEGDEIVKKLKGRINTKKGGEAPNFEGKDIKGIIISLSSLRSKYILLDFWASWCAPCLRLSPSIKEIRNKYPIDKLEIISVTLDNNYTEFQTALRKINPNWTQIFNGHDLINKYAIAPIPQIYLIDPNGIVIYNMEEEKDYELLKLKQIIKQIII